MIDTRDINRFMAPPGDEAETWLFGYGSLIYKMDFPFLERRAAAISGWSRRFWQGSHDHRGTPEAPGRVLTLIRDDHALCAGIAYRISHDVFAHLDHREKNGYLRRHVAIVFSDDVERDGETHATGVTYVADPGNGAWLGPAADDEIARHIACARGPSGSNRDYVIDLAVALRALGANDAHVFAIEHELLRIETDEAPALT